MFGSVKYVFWVGGGDIYISQVKNQRNYKSPDWRVLKKTRLAIPVVKTKPQLPGHN